MGSNKDRIEILETSFCEMQDEIQNMKQGMADKFQSLEAVFQRLAETVTNNREGGSNGAQPGRRIEGSNNTPHHLETTNNPFALSRSVKLEFPRFRGGDPTSWISKVKQYFSYQDTPLEQRVQYASYHLEEEANEWWQAMSKALQEDQNKVAWAVTEEEMWSRFGPTEGGNFDEALSKIQQTGTLQEFQHEFERLQNKVAGWTQKALVGTYLGGLNPFIADSIRMFRPRSLKEVIGLARMCDDQLQKQKQGSDVYDRTPSRLAPSAPITQRDTPTLETAATPQQHKLSWDDLKAKRSLGLCFSCDERYLPGHTCKQAQLFIMESMADEDAEYENLEDKVLFEGGVLMGQQMVKCLTDDQTI